MQPRDFKSPSDLLFKPPAFSSSTASASDSKPPSLSSISITSSTSTSTPKVPTSSISSISSTPNNHNNTARSATKVQPVALSPMEAYEIFSSPRFESFYSTIVEPYLLSTTTTAASSSTCGSGGLFPCPSPSLGLFSESSMTSLPTVVTSTSNCSLYPISFAPSPAPVLESHYYDFEAGAGGLTGVLGEFDEFEKELSSFDSSSASTSTSSASTSTTTSSSSSFSYSAAAVRPVLSDSALTWYSSDSNNRTTPAPPQHSSTPFIPPPSSASSPSPFALLPLPPVPSASSFSAPEEELCFEIQQPPRAPTPVQSFQVQQSPPQPQLLHPQPTHGSYVGGVGIPAALRTPSPNPLMMANSSNPTSRMSASPSTSSRTPEQRSLFQPEERKRSAPPYLLLGRSSPASNMFSSATPKPSSSTSPSPAVSSPSSSSSASGSSVSPSPPPTTTSSSTATSASSPGNTAANNKEERKISLTFANPKKRKSRSKDPNSKRARRLIWTGELQCLFLEAIQFLGCEEATPTSILLYMKVPGLTRENISSHLQKHRQKNTSSTTTGTPPANSPPIPIVALPVEENASS